MQKVRGSGGFTLIELLATMALAAVLVTMTLPDLHKLLLDARLNAATHALRDSLEYAREQALIRRVPVALCRSDETGASLPACAHGDGWRDGWLVFLDSDGNARPDQPADVLQVHGPVDAQLVLAANRGIADAVRFRSDGTSPASAGHFTICDRQARRPAHRVVISFGGRVRVPLAGGRCATS
jgi:prepilin-type N-terminal cleavage/methylation domain